MQENKKQSKLFPNYKRQPFEIMSGEGCYVKDNFGKTYLDLTSGIGVINLGYNHPKVKSAVQDQLELIWHVPNLYENQLQEKVAQKIIGEKEYLAYFCNSGAEANEAALKLARKATGKSKIITFFHSFHGRTFGAMSATGQGKIHDGFGPIVPDFHYLPYNDFSALEQAADDRTAAIMLEIIQGEGGVIPAEKQWLAQVQKLCKEKNILLIVDEIQTGIGRTGKLFAFEHYDLTPDIFTLAKALGNGLPVGAMIGKKSLGESFGAGTHGSTFGGNKVVLAGADKVLEEIKKPEFLSEVEAKGQFAMSLLHETIASLSAVTDIRGKGLMIGIEINTDITKIMSEIKKQGVLVLQAGSNVIRLLPPLTITEQELAEGIYVIENSLKNM